MNIEETKKYYEEHIKKYGRTPQGLDWGDKCTEEQLNLRYQNMLNVIKASSSFTGGIPSLLDVGCGFCGLKEYAEKKGIKIRYYGIDLYNLDKKDYVFVGDFLEHKFNEDFDFVVCNGILTATMGNSLKEFDKLAIKFIDKMFDIANRGIAFNIMKSQVEFMREGLYYKSPLDVLGYCMTLTDKFVIDAAYPLYEYTVYLYKE